MPPPKTDLNVGVVSLIPVGVQSVSPSPGVLGVPTDTSVRVTFNRPIRTEGLPAGWFSIADQAGNTVGASVMLEETGTATVGETAGIAYARAASLRPNQPLDAGATYTVTVKDVADLSGAAIAAPYVWDFTTALAGAPGVTAVTPTDVYIDRLPAEVAVTGQNFVAGAQVAFVSGGSEVPAQAVTFDSDTQLEVTLPSVDSGLSYGKYDVRVTTRTARRGPSPQGCG